MKFFLLAWLVGLPVSGVLAAVQWQPRLMPPESGSYHGPLETIRLHIPPEVPIEVLQQLGLEVDNIDVTALVSRDGDYAVYTPQQPLEWGMHRLLLVEYTQDGGILERGSWDLEVRKSESFREAELNISASLEASRRIGEGDLDAPPARTQGSGSLTLQGRLADGSWQAGMQLPLIYNSQAARRLDGGEFLFDREQDSLTARAGHHPVSPESLILSGFNRRGLSATYTWPGSGSSITGFAMRGNQVSGFEEGLGLGDSDNRIHGAVASVRPLPGGSEALELSAAYLSGEAPELGAGVAGDDVSTGGDVWSVSADGLLLDNRLRLRGEYARSAYDFDGAGGEGGRARPWLLPAGELQALAGQAD